MNIRTIRLYICAHESRGIYLPDVSAALDISIYVLKNIEDGKYPTVKILAFYILAKFFPLLVSLIFNFNDMQVSASRN